MTRVLELRVKKSKGMPLPTTAEIVVKRHMKDEGSDTIIITPRCLTYQEIDYQISLLIKELEEIRTKSKKTFNR